MKKLNKSLSKRVLTVLNKDANFRDAYQMVCNRSITKPYLVGGKLYRTLIELTYDYPARSHSCDFDFAANEIRSKKRYKKKKIYNPLTELYEVKKFAVPSRYDGSINMRTDSGAKIDLIGISGLASVKTKKQPLSIQGYLGCVPLSVQAIAMDVDRCEIFGKIGLDSINEKYVWVNNEEVLKEYIKRVGGTADNYLKTKADSIKFGCHVKTPKRNQYSSFGYGYGYESPHLQWQQEAQTISEHETALLAGQQAALQEYANTLTATQGQYVQDVMDTNVGAQVFVVAGNLYCVFDGRTWSYDGNVFNIVETNTAV
jgi:hypothetical protein